MVNIGLPIDAPDHLYLSQAELCCLEEADVNSSGGDPDITDITVLIDHLY